MFDDIYNNMKENKNRTKYATELETILCKDGQVEKVLLNVIDVNPGFNVLVKDDKLNMIKWFEELDEAIEFAVDYKREYQKNKS